MVQIILASVLMVVGAVVVFLVYRSRKNQRERLVYQQKMSVEDLAEIVGRDLSEKIRVNNMAIGDENYKRTLRKKQELSKALDQCIYGVPKYQNLVKSYINTILRSELKDENACCSIVKFDTPLADINPNYQWEMLLYLASKRDKKAPFSYLNSKYHFDKLVNRRDEDNSNPDRYIVDTLRLVECLRQELIDYGKLKGKDSCDPRTGQYKFTYNDMCLILTILVYNVQYGFGVVNTLRGLDVDGFNFGTSGSVRYVIDGNFDIPYTATNSIWIQVNAKWVHFSCLDFGSEAEMKRVVNRLVAWGTTAPMTEKQPYKVNDGYDGARITAIRPPAGECWACFCRKFSAGLYVKDKLLCKKDKDGNEIMHNWQLPSTLMRYLMRSEQTCAFTGQQNTGKTSMMKATMADIAMVNVRVLEMSFELAIRELYPWKNVITVKPTDYVSSAQLQDLLKKTDGYLSMVGEVAEDIVAARMIQFCLIASAFTIFSHHAKTDHDLINGLANSLVACGEYENHDVAISTVLDAIKNNIHLDFCKGQRVIAYISEIVKLDEIAPYPNLKEVDSVAGAINQLSRLQREYYTRSTDRIRFASRHIIKFDPEDMTYKANMLYTPETLRKILNKLNPDERKSFIRFYRENWGHLMGKEKANA